jgi:hypothetical protein
LSAWPCSSGEGVEFCLNLGGFCSTDLLEDGQGLPQVGFCLDGAPSGLGAAPEAGESGEAWFRVRWSRWVLQKSSYSRWTVIRWRWFQIKVRTP